MTDEIDALSKRLFGIPAIRAVLIVGLPCLFGLVAAMLFPKTDAYVMLQFSEDKVPVNAVELEAYKRLAASYGSAQTLRAYVEAKIPPQSPVAQVISDRISGDFWERMVSPVFSFSKTDQRQLGDVKDATTTNLIGVELIASARTPDAAGSLVLLLSDYVGDAIIREKLRGWIRLRRGQIAADEPRLRAEILRMELDIQMNERRALYMKDIIARYPDATRMDVRQVLNVSSTEGGERFLSPLAQLVGAESAISERREKISRLNREVRQLRAAAPFFEAAEEAINKTLDTRKLLIHLQQLADEKFPESKLNEDWAAEAALDLQSMLKTFANARSQIDIRTGVRTRPTSSRSPIRLALIGAGIGIALLSLLALLRFNKFAFPNEPRRERGSLD